jgi:arylsulfatase A-like enzyme
MDVHDWHQRRLEYAEAVEVVDEAVGDLVSELNQNGLLDDAVLILVGDHGEALGERHLLPTMPTHFGNPSFEQVLAVPLVVVGAEVEEDGVPIRSEDLYHLFERLVGLPVSSASDLQPGELFLTEARYRTYRRGRWKSFWRRIDGDFRLVDLASDPDEKTDVSEEHPEIAAAHRARMSELTERLAAPKAPVRELTRDEIDVLQALGYLEPADDRASAPSPPASRESDSGDGRVREMGSRLLRSP